MSGIVIGSNTDGKIEAIADHAGSDTENSYELKSMVFGCLDKLYNRIQDCFINRRDIKYNAKRYVESCVVRDAPLGIDLAMVEAPTYSTT
jgi:hypothetical protein